MHSDNRLGIAPLSPPVQSLGQLSRRFVLKQLTTTIRRASSSQEISRAKLRGQTPPPLSDSHFKCESTTPFAHFCTSRSVTQFDGALKYNLPVAFVDGFIGDFTFIWKVAFLNPLFLFSRIVEIAVSVTPLGSIAEARKC